MRLLFWSELFRPHIGGVEVWSVQLIQALRALGYECAAISSHGPTLQPDQAQFEGIVVHRFPFHTALQSGDLRAIKRITASVAAVKRSFSPDLIHLNTSRPSLFFHERTASAHACPTLFTVHEPPLASTAGNSMLGRVLESADWVVGVSNAMLHDAQSVAPSIRGKSSVIHNSIVTGSVAAARARPDPPVLLCVGRLVYEKGFDLALEAFAKLRSAHLGVRMTIAGDGPMRAELERQAQRLGIAADVSFEGWVEPDAVHALMQAASIVIVPSRWREPFGLVALQAAGAARPVVACDTGGLAEIVVHRKTGLLVSPTSSASIADAVDSLLRQPEVAIAMGDAAHERKRRNFDFDTFVSSYDELYRRLTRVHGNEDAAGPRA